MSKPTFDSDFEGVYLRHDYLKRIDPSKVNFDDYNKFLKISTITGKMMYDKYRFNFDRVSFSADDVACVANIYLYSYLGLYSLKSNPETKTNKLYLDRYLQRNGRYPSVEELERIDRNLLIAFLRQKLHHCSTVCSRKARNIIIGKDVHIAVAETQNSKELPQSALYAEWKNSGFRRVEQRELKEAKRNVTEKQLECLVDKNGYKIIELDIPYEGITLDDYRQIFYSNKMDEYTNTPEQLLCNQEDEIRLSSFKETFDNLTEKQRVNVLNRFINKNKNKPGYKKEVATARKLLKGEEVVV